MNTWPDPCGCKPGTYENGWHESRCEMCRKVERDVWARAMELSRTIVKRLRNDSKAS